MRTMTTPRHKSSEPILAPSAVALPDGTLVATAAATVMVASSRLMWMRLWKTRSRRIIARVPHIEPQESIHARERAQRVSRGNGAGQGAPASDRVGGVRGAKPRYAPASERSE